MTAPRRADVAPPPALSTRSHRELAFALRRLPAPHLPDGRLDDAALVRPWVQGWLADRWSTATSVAGVDAGLAAPDLVAELRAAAVATDPTLHDRLAALDDAALAAVVATVRAQLDAPLIEFARLEAAATRVERSQSTMLTTAELTALLQSPDPRHLVLGTQAASLRRSLHDYAMGRRPLPAPTR